jgi:hypothetical protein
MAREAGKEFDLGEPHGDMVKVLERFEALVRADEQALEAQRTWVDLTDEEITDIWYETAPYYHQDDFARAILAKSKEKNT